MNKSKIPVLSEGLGRSLIPRPVKDKKIMMGKENKPQIKFPSKLQAPTFKPKLSAAKPATAISEVMVDKCSKEILFNNKQMKNLSECPRVKLIKERKSTLKTEAASKLLKKSTGKVSSNIVERLPVRSNTSSQQDKYHKKSRPKTVSKQKLINQKPQSIKGSDCVKESNPVIKSHRIAVKESVIDKAKTPTKLKESESNLDENDIEFQASGFYKKLILAEKELSPGIIKLCANKHFSSMLAHMDSPGKVLLMKNPPADHLVEDLKRNSAMFHRLKGKLQYSPYLSDKGSPFKRTPCQLFSAKQNMEIRDLARQIRRESELKNVALEKSHLESFNPNFRRWTTNTPRKFEISADTVRRLSEGRKDAGLPVSVKCIKQASSYELECLNPHERVLRELNKLTVKKKVKSKKKVTFDIPKSSPTNVEISEATSNNNLECGLATILENSSKVSTPELNSDKSKDSASNDNKEICENPPQVTTPELHLNSSRINASLLPLGKEFSYEQRCKDKITTPEFDLKASYCLHEHNIQNVQFCTNNKDSSDSLPLDIQIKKLQKSSKLGENKNVTTSDVSNFKNLPSEIDLEMYNFSVKDSVHIPTTCLIQSMENIAITSISEQLNQAEKCYSISEKNIFTPDPVSLCSKLANDVTPLFLTTKSTDIGSYVPIYTPYALKSLAESERSSLSPVCQRLQFKDESELSVERRESQIYIQNIPTLQKTYDYLCDQECSIFSSQSATIQLNRNLNNPVASVLNEGDQMHFLPLRLS